MRQQQRDRETKGRERYIEEHVCSEQRPRLRLVPPIRPRTDNIATDAEPKHEDGDDDGGGVDGVAKDVPEDADPDDLVDEATKAGEEEEEVDQIPMTKSQTPN